MFSSSQIAAILGQGPSVANKNDSTLANHIHRLRRVLPPLVMIGIGVWRISGASFWRDEAATLSATKRSLPALFHMLSKTDVVHATYYLAMFPWTRIAGTTELDMRIPSVVAMSIAAIVVSAMVARLRSERTGLIAGLIFALLPVVSRYAQEARSYAFVMALAVLSSYILIRVIQEPAVKRWPALYWVVLVMLGWANLMSLLIIPAHGITVIGAARKRSAELPCRSESTVSAPGVEHIFAVRARRPQSPALAWMISVVATVIAVGPLVLLAWPQREGTARFLARISVSTVGDMPGRLTGSWPVLVAMLILIIVAARAASSRTEINWLCIPWAIVPAGILLIVGAFAPVYDPRYILFCVPPLAVLAAVGLDSLANQVDAYILDRQYGKNDVNRVGGELIYSHSVRRQFACILMGIVLIGAAGIPAQFSYRAADGHIDNIRLAAQIVASHERKGDAVLYQPPWWRQVSAAYSFGFNHLHDISLQHSPATVGNFTGSQFSVDQIRQRLQNTRRVWLVEYASFEPDPAIGHGWNRIGFWHPGTLILALYQRQ